MKSNVIAVLVFGATFTAMPVAYSQESEPGGFAATPPTELNQVPSPGNVRPADPSAESDPAARVPTDPILKRENEREADQSAEMVEPAPVPAPSAPPADVQD